MPTPVRNITEDLVGAFVRNTVPPRDACSLAAFESELQLRQRLWRLTVS
jgi:hypothetical protein